jgi:hypothetical protein
MSVIFSCCASAERAVSAVPQGSGPASWCCYITQRLYAFHAGRPLSVLCQLFPKAVDLLLGDKAMLSGVGPVCRGQAGTVDSAVSFVYTAG